MGRIKLGVGRQKESCFSESWDGSVESLVLPLAAGWQRVGGESLLYRDPIQSESFIPLIRVFSGRINVLSLD